MCHLASHWIEDSPFIQLKINTKYLKDCLSYLTWNQPSLFDSKNKIKFPRNRTRIDFHNGHIPVSGYVMGHLGLELESGKKAEPALDTDGLGISDELWPWQKCSVGVSMVTGPVEVFPGTPWWTFVWLPRAGQMLFLGLLGPDFFIVAVNTGTNVYNQNAQSHSHTGTRVCIKFKLWLKPIKHCWTCSRLKLRLPFSHIKQWGKDDPGNCILTFQLPPNSKQISFKKLVATVWWTLIYSLIA